MGPFDFIIMFISFVYTLALTHVLFAVSRMIRHRRVVVLSWPHSLWMLNALILLTANWISMWDFRHFDRMPLAIIVAGLLFAIFQYVICVLVSPDIDDGEGFDMRAFHEREGRSYIAVNLLMVFMAVAANAAAGLAAGVENWAAQNVVVIAMLPPVLLALIIRRPWAQVVGPLVLASLQTIFLIAHYPVLTR